ncbi:MAG: hypothetical protein Q9181_003288 [Wetmoreana brouardii]
MALKTSAHQIDAASGIELRNLSHRETRNTTLVDDPTTTARPRHPAAEQDPTRLTNLVELQQWWSSVICPTVNHNPSVDRSLHNNDARDYLALERTFLARVRTANALALFGVALVQLLRLNNLDPKAGLAIGAVTAGGGAIIVLAGGYRFFLQQRKLLCGKALAGGPLAWITWALLIGVFVAVLVIVLVEGS